MKIWNFVTGAFQVNTFVVHLKDKYVFVVDPGGDILTISQFLAAQELEPVTKFHIFKDNTAYDYRYDLYGDYSF